MKDFLINYLLNILFESTESDKRFRRWKLAVQKSMGWATHDIESDYGKYQVVASTQFQADDKRVRENKIKSGLLGSEWRS